MVGDAAVAATRSVLRSCRLLLRWLWAGQLGGHLHEWWQLRRAALRLRTSPAFDARWYRTTYPDVAAARIDPALHYLRRGVQEGRAPLPVANPRSPPLALTDANYRVWIAALETPDTAAPANTRTTIEHLTWRPSFGIVLFGGDDAAGAMTLGSLEAQVYPDWCLTDVACGDLMLFLAAGTCLAPTALLRIAAAVAAERSIEVVYTDEDRIGPEGSRGRPWFKPPWDPVLAEHCDLIGTTGVYRRRLLDQLDIARVTNCAGLREVTRRVVTEVSPESVRHIPNVLFHIGYETARAHVTQDRTVLPLPLRASAAKWARRGGRGQYSRRRGMVLALAPPPTLGPIRHPSSQQRGEHRSLPTVTIIIATRDRAALLARCADGILRRTDYAPIELIIVDNDSHERRTARLLTRLAADPRVRVLPIPGPFNWSAMNNAGARETRGEIIVLLNNDIDVINPTWLHEMVALAQQPGIGIVGARLLYPDGTLQHAGMILGSGGMATHLYRGAARNEPGHGGMLRHPRSVAAVTGACMAMRRAVFETVGGLETEHLAVTGNDVDLCLRVRAHGWRVVCTPHAELYHREAASRGPDFRAEQLARVARERAYLVQRWGARAEHDPYLNPNLAVVNEQLVMSTRIASPGRAIADERRRDRLDVGQQVGRQPAGVRRDPADTQRIR
jgi:GT2 family glycosyltransferase